MLHELLIKNNTNVKKKKAKIIAFIDLYATSLKVKLCCQTTAAVFLLSNRSESSAWWLLNGQSSYSSSDYGNPNNLGPLRDKIINKGCFVTDTHAPSMLKRHSN